MSCDITHPIRSLKRKNTELSVLASRLCLNSYRSQRSEHSIPVQMLKAYLSDLLFSLASASIPPAYYQQLPSMRKILHDCMALSNVSLEFYSHVETAFELVTRIHEDSSASLLPDLHLLLTKVIQMVDDHNYLAKWVSVSIKGGNSYSIDELLAELRVKMGRVTARLINIWRKILCNIDEFETVSTGFLRFYANVDRGIKAVLEEPPVAAMDIIARNPGKVVQVVRKTVVYIEGEMISIRSARDVYALLQKTPPEVIAYVDKTMTAFTLWDLIRSALEYYRAYGLCHYSVDIFDKDLDLDLLDSQISPKEPQTNSDKTTPKRALGEIASIHEGKKAIERRCKETDKKRRSSPIRVKSASPSKASLHDSKDFSNNPTYSLTEADLPSDDLTNSYELYIAEKFQDFLIEKLKQNQRPVWEENKAEILSEFNSFVESLDRKKISELWAAENLSKEASRLSLS